MAAPDQNTTAAAVVATMMTTEGPSKGTMEAPRAMTTAAMATMTAVPSGTIADRPVVLSPAMDAQAERA